jgi:hypothetical protein
MTTTNLACFVHCPCSSCVIDDCQIDTPEARWQDVLFPRARLPAEKEKERGFLLQDASS